MTKTCSSLKGKNKGGKLMCRMRSSSAINCFVI